MLVALYTNKLVLVCDLMVFCITNGDNPPIAVFTYLNQHLLLSEVYSYWEHCFAVGLGVSTYVHNPPRVHMISNSYFQW